MTAALLTTKLYIPPVRREMVLRPRLMERLNAGLDGKLTLVSAPAGFGKTTLLSEWAHPKDMAARVPPVAWLSLDVADNEPLRFWSYVIAALQTARQDVGITAMAALRSSQPPPIESLLIDLINEIAGLPDRLILVLDDLHSITASQIHDALLFLVDNLPRSMHLILSGRADPPWPLAHLRARGEMSELRTEDLRFTPEEVVVFLNDVVGLGLSAEDITALENRTEGWIAGLQMATLSMQGREDVSAFIRAFSGDHRFILDYLVEQVLDRQSSDVHDFLLKTSILERMTASLCDAVRFGVAEPSSSSLGTTGAGWGDSRAILAQVERANLFLIPLDDERSWYRYHHLFADLLRSRLEWSQPDQVAVLHHRAAEWYERNGFMEDAVRHALETQDFDLSARLITQVAFALWARSDVLRLFSWIKALPEDRVYSQPSLCMHLAWAFAITGRFDAVEGFLQFIESHLQQAGLSPDVLWPVDRREALAQPDPTDAQHAEGQRLSIWMDLVRAFVTRFQGNVSDANVLCERVLERIPVDNSRMRGQALLILGHAYLLAGRVEAEPTLLDAIQVNRAAGFDSAYLSAVHYLAELRMLQGRLGQAEVLYREALQFVAEREEPHLAGIEHIGIGDLLRERNDLDGAAYHIQEGLRFAERGGDFAFLLEGYIARARLEQALGNWADALAYVQKADQIARRSPASRNVALVEAWQARLRLARGDLAAAERWLGACGLSAGDELDPLREFGHLTSARVFLAQGKLDRAGQLLERLLQSAETAGRMSQVIEALVLQALTLQAKGQIAQAVSTLERALSLAEPEGYVRILIDEGMPMGELLRQAAARGIAAGYVSRLLSTLEGPRREGWVAEPPLGSPTPPLIEPLSTREREVLRLLNTCLSTPEIAQELVISTNTVRSHVKNIYGKLRVHRRMDAIRRAKELGLL